MSYRKLEIDGVLYEYSIGKTHTKIRYIGAYKNEELGNFRTNGIQEWWDHPDGSFQITPKDLAFFIKRNKLSHKDRDK